MSTLTGLRVLVVEDEPVVAMCLEDILEELGCVTVGPASRLSEGLSLAEERLDAAILDINLAGERSNAIAERLRARGIPFVFASGYGVAPEGYGAPMIEKPYRTDDIGAALTAILAGPR
ncbi:MAG: response regulator [Alphaproteobacteria bacterium]|nr:MAG: response regulator [Alphaproteobacteria bacterium]